MLMPRAAASGWAPNRDPPCAAPAADMKRLLLQASKSSLFLRRPEGRRFLAHVLTLHPSMVAEVASVMRNMVSGGADGASLGRGQGRAGVVWKRLGGRNRRRRSSKRSCMAVAGM
jgi:hypothetical protein